MTHRENPGIRMETASLKIRKSTGFFNFCIWILFYFLKNQPISL